MATTLKSVNYNVAMTFIFNYNNNDNAATKNCRYVTADSCIGQWWTF